MEAVLFFSSEQRILRTGEIFLDQSDLPWRMYHNTSNMANNFVCPLYTTIAPDNMLFSSKAY